MEKISSWFPKNRKAESEDIASPLLGATCDATKSCGNTSINFVARENTTVLNNKKEMLKVNWFDKLGYGMSL